MNRSPFGRGAVVARADRYAVVWSDAGGSAFECLAIRHPRESRAGDVLLELSDLIAMGAPIAFAVIRGGRLRSETSERWQLVGQVPGPVLCRVVQSVVRAAVSAAAADRWAGDSAHKRLAASPMVNLLR